MTMARAKEFDPDEALDRALDLFWDRGFSATSMQNLVDTMGIGRGSLYETFGSKENLFAEALDRYAARSVDFMVQTITDSEEPLEGIRTLIRGFARSAANGGNTRGCLMVNTIVELAPHDEAMAEILRRHWGRVENAITKVLRRAQDTGDLDRAKKPRALARHLVNTIQGLAVQGKYVRTRSSANDVADIALSVLE